MSKHQFPSRTASDRPRLPRAIWAIGMVSLLMDVSSEMIHGLMPVFLVGVLGASTVTVGLIEGIGEATASVVKLVSGVVSDRLGKRKLLTVIGYGLSTLSKPFFAAAPTPMWVAGARVADRMGKGIRGAPRDALVGDIAPPGMRGAAYGLRQALDNVGAFVGPLLAIGLMMLFAGNIRAVFWVALVPGLAAVAVLVSFVHEPQPRAPTGKARLPMNRAALGALGRPFWVVVAVTSILTLARFSEAFVILRAEGLGLAVALAPLVLVGVHVASSLSSYPAGVLGDRLPPRRILAVGFAALIGADLCLAFAQGLVPVAAGVLLWGLHLGLSQGLLQALVAETAPEELRATAFGLFNLVAGLTLLVASVLAGALWALGGPMLTFLSGAAIAALGVIGLSRLPSGR